MSSLLKSHSSKMSLNHLVSALQLPPLGQRVSSYTPPRIQTRIALFGWEVTGGKNKQLDNSNQIATAVLLLLSKHQVTGVLFQSVVKIIIGVQGHLYMAGIRTGLLTSTSPAFSPITSTTWVSPTLALCTSLPQNCLDLRGTQKSALMQADKLICLCSLLLQFGSQKMLHI